MLEKEQGKDKERVQRQLGGRGHNSFTPKVRKVLFVKVTFEQRLKGGKEFSHGHFGGQSISGQENTEKTLKYTYVYICMYVYVYIHT